MCVRCVCGYARALLVKRWVAQQQTLYVEGSRTPAFGLKAVLYHPKAFSFRYVQVGRVRANTVSGFEDMH